MDWGVLEQGAEENIGLKGDDVTGSWRKLHNEYCVPSIMRKTKR
jgi:hypothetical protein